MGRALRLDIIATGRMDNELADNEQAGAAEDMLEIIEAINFFITATGKPALREVDGDEYSIHLENLNKVVLSLTSSIRTRIEIIDGRREEMEKIFSQISNIN